MNRSLVVGLVGAGLMAAAPALADPPVAAAPSPVSPPPPTPVMGPPLYPGLPPLPAISPTGPFAWAPRPGQPVRVRDGGAIAGGVTLLSLGAAAGLTGVVLFFTGFVVGATGNDAWKDYVGAGAASLAFGGLGIGFGVPLLKRGTRGTLKEPDPSAQLWLAPARFTMTF